jgi:hypothetical protein
MQQQSSAYGAPHRSAIGLNGESKVKPADLDTYLASLDLAAIAKL